LSQKTLEQSTSTEDNLTDKYEKHQGRRLVPRSQSLLARATSAAFKSATKAAYQKKSGILTPQTTNKKGSDLNTKSSKDKPAYYFADKEDKASLFKYHKEYHTPSGLINHSYIFASKQEEVEQLDKNGPSETTTSKEYLKNYKN
jgi:hypothetical protein